MTSPSVQKQWQQWTYYDWNLALLLHCFSDAKTRAPVERIVATPEELFRLAGEPDNSPYVVEHFVGKIRSVLTERRRTIRNFCLNQDWRPIAKAPPPFFGVLWLTCLIAHGYPDTSKRFGDRLKQVLGTSQQLDCLPEAWLSLAEWLETGAKIGFSPRYREILLPPFDGYRKNIGESWFLAFPHQEDRAKLQIVLTRHGLQGLDPPLLSTARILMEQSKNFSDGFRKDLREFYSTLQSGEDMAHENAFWQAVCREARLGLAADTQECLVLLATVAGGNLTPFIGTRGSELPAGLSMRDLDVEIDECRHFVVLEGDDSEDFLTPSLELFAGRLKCSPGSLYVDRGVVLFEEVLHHFKVVGGSAAQGVRTALVRNDLVDHFLAAYGGTYEPSIVEGWTEILDAFVEIDESLPQGLESVHHLKPTSLIRRSVRLVGGIRLPDGFLAVKGMLPIIRARGAQDVSLIDLSGTRYPLARSTGCDEWVMLAEILGSKCLEFIVVACWHSESDIIEKRAALRFSSGQLGTTYKGLLKGSYTHESWDPGEITIQHDTRIPFSSMYHHSTGRYAVKSCLYTDQAVDGPGTDHRGSLLLEALAALSLNRGGVPLGVVVELASNILSDLTTQERQGILRGLNEIGCLDIAQKRGAASTFMIARRPQLICIGESGPLEGRLTGLVPHHLRDLIVRVAARLGIARHVLLPSTHFLPCVQVFVGSSFEHLEELCRACAVQGPISASLLPRPRNGLADPSPQLRAGEISPNLSPGRSWDYALGRFSEARPEELVEVREFVHPRHPRVFGVFADGRLLGWTYSRNWALLTGWYWSSKTLPFRRTQQGIVRCEGAPNIFLPLVLGRLCALFGSALPGPTTSSTGKLDGGYVYPIDEGLLPKLKLAAETLEQDKCKENLMKHGRVVAALHQSRSDTWMIPGSVEMSNATPLTQNLVQSLKYWSRRRRSQ